MIIAAYMDFNILGKGKGRFAKSKQIVIFTDTFLIRLQIILVHHLHHLLDGVCCNDLTDV